MNESSLVSQNYKNRLKRSLIKLTRQLFLNSIKKNKDPYLKSLCITNNKKTSPGLRLRTPQKQLSPKKTLATGFEEK